MSEQRLNTANTGSPLPVDVVTYAPGGHKVFADHDSSLTFLEYFSRGEHETVFVEQGCVWRPQAPEADTRREAPGAP